MARCKTKQPTNKHSASLYHNSSVGLNTQDVSNWHKNLAYFMVVRYLTPELSQGKRMNFFTYIFLPMRYPLQEPSIHEKRFEFMRIYIYIYIYIYCHPQTDYFVLLELFSVARHAGRSKPWFKPIQLYVTLGLRPLGQQADYVGKGNFKVSMWQQQQRPFVYILISYRLPECLLLSKSFALCERRPTIPSPECSTPMGEHFVLFSSLSDQYTCDT